VALNLFHMLVSYGMNSASQSLGPVGRAAEYAGNWVAPNLVPDIPTAVDLFHNGLQSSSQLVNDLRMNGAFLPEVPAPNAPWKTERDQTDYTGPAQFSPMNSWKAFVESRVRMPTTGEILELLNRDRITANAADAMLGRSGFSSSQLRTAILDLRKNIPGISDLIHFALKEAWDDNIAGLYEYDREFPAPFQHWAERQGFGWDARTPAQKTAGQSQISWPRLYWRAHWQPISPTQAYQMFHRLRPGRGARYAFGGIAPRPFTAQNLNDVLKINDYPVSFRDQLAAMSTSVLRLVDIRRLYDLGIIDELEVFEQYRDRGYVPRDATSLTQWVVRNKEKTENKARSAFTKKQVCSLYRSGALGRGSAARHLFQMQLVDPFALAIWNTMTLADKELMAANAPHVQAQLDTCDLESEVEIYKAAARAIRKKLHCGRIDGPQADAELANVGVATHRRQQLVNLWIIERDSICREASLAQLLKGLRYGFITAAQANTRLANLGYSQADANLIIADIGRNMALDFARAQEKAAKTVQQRASALKRQLRELATESKRARTELARTASPAKLARYYKLRLIDRGTAFRRLVALEYPPADANLMLDEVDATRAGRS
jgi:hypothetical protein